MLVSYLYAAPEKGAQMQQSPISGLMPLILIFFVFYFLLIRPQKKQMNEQKQMLNSLKKGDEIVTSGGIHGRISALKGKIIEVEIASQTVITVNKSAVSYRKQELAVSENEKNNKEES